MLAALSGLTSTLLFTAGVYLTHSAASSFAACDAEARDLYDNMSTVIKLPSHSEVDLWAISHGNFQNLLVTSTRCGCTEVQHLFMQYMEPQQLNDIDPNMVHVCFGFIETMNENLCNMTCVY